MELTPSQEKIFLWISMNFNELLDEFYEPQGTILHWKLTVIMDFRFVKSIVGCVHILVLDTNPASWQKESKMLAYIKLNKVKYYVMNPRNVS